MSRLIVVSNRLPITVNIDSGTIRTTPSVGGLATGMSSLDMEQESLWIGWAGSDITENSKKDVNDLKRVLRKDNLYPVLITNQEIDDYYHGFSNETIWPLFHYFSQYAVYDKKFWNSYVKVNEKFRDIVVGTARPNDIIWIHDYHLMLLPKLVREKLPTAQIGFFLHIPFPSSEIFRLLPWRKEIIEGLLGADLVGFHTFDYVRHFAESVRRIIGIEHHLGKFTVDQRPIKTDAFPMGIDFDKYYKSPQKSAVKNKIKDIKKQIGNADQTLILSIDRLDYTKGISQRLEAYKLFLKNNPEYREKVTFFFIIVPSRTEVPHYKQLKEQIDNLVGKINGQFGTLSWNPIRYLYRSFDFNDLMALYSLADILFITPLRDGMNLVAKEFVAAKADGQGVLILGEMAGTAKELGEALVINPNDVDQTADTLRMAIKMPDEDKRKRMIAMQERLKRYDIKRWATDFMESLNQMKMLREMMLSIEISTNTMKKLTSKYKKRSNCLFLLDYDGSLVGFDKDPLKTAPDDGLSKLLNSLSRNKKNEVVIISGRSKDILEKWLGKMSNGLAAEHGMWIRDRNKKWKMIEHLSADWKKDIKPILELFVDRTPKSFVEEKKYSLAWHYREVDPALAMVRVGELKDTLSHKMVNMEVGVLEGNKVVEIKFSGINKGRAALFWLEKRKWDIVIAIGDDWTDEDLFEVLPDTAFSIKVGHGASKAKYRLPNVQACKGFLDQLSRVK